jgi:SM-20-related protein
VLETTHLRKHLDELSEKMWTLIPFDQVQSSDLLKSAQRRLQNHQFRQAGLAAIQSVSDSSLQIRNDEIFWLDSKSHDLSEVEKKTLIFLENLRQEIKNDLRVSLSEFECHFAFYDTGHFYQKHRDITSTNNKRVFSFVLYLNENWKDTDGGHLVGYDQENIIFRIKPELGQMILFRSDLEHEVMPTLRGRFSLTGWFRK